MIALMPVPLTPRVEKSSYADSKIRSRALIGSGQDSTDSRTARCDLPTRRGARQRKFDRNVPGDSEIVAARAFLGTQGRTPVVGRLPHLTDLPVMLPRAERATSDSATLAIRTTPAFIADQWSRAAGPVEPSVNLSLTDLCDGTYRLTGQG